MITEPRLADLPLSPAQPPRGTVRRCELDPYTVPSRRRALWDLMTSVGGYGICMAITLLGLMHGAWPMLALTPLTAMFQLRTYIVFHDCAHGSFWPSRRVNQWLGVACGLLVVTPFVRWRYDHAVHHATSGDLDKRGIGDVPTMTLAEYRSAGRRRRAGYRLFRNPAIMFGLGPIMAMIIGPRLVSRNAPPRMVRSVLLTDLAIAVVAIPAAIWLGPTLLALAWVPPALLAGSVGIWLFYVQHQFEDAYWRRSEQWSYESAALSGSSFLSLPAVLRFATGNIGYHHVHHLSVRIPNYNLRRAHEELAIFRSVPELSIRQGLSAIRLKLWDESNGRLVTWKQAKLSPGGTLAESSA